MDSRKSILHEHPCFPSPRFVFGECDGCHVSGLIYGGYFCNESIFCACFHKECAEAPLEINHHPSHTEHPLLLTNDSRPEDDTLCDSCGQKLLSPYYTCLTCEFKVDLLCGIKPSPSAIEHPVCHDHPLVFLKKREEEAVPCEVCKESIGGPSYSCPECNNVYFHWDCVHLSKEVNHPCHSSHPLKIIASESLTNDDAEKTCYLCSVQEEKLLYHCFICNFTVCLVCTKLPPPLVVDHAKTHAHPLRLFSSKIVFTCKLCGIEGHEPKPYICLECDFVVHGYCLGLPRVVNINRHDHRISFTHHLGPGRTECGVCRKSVSQYYGAYYCSVCPNYAVHSRCVLDNSLWDGRELEGIPEISEDIAPFKVVGHNLIRHFMHDKHTLALKKDYVFNSQDYEWLRCAACIRPIGFAPIYSCEECKYFLHEKCAKLPMKKKLVFDPTPYILQNFMRAFCCKLCGILFDGLKYTSQGVFTSYRYVDVHCGSISEPLVHKGHLHPLYFYKLIKNHYCAACKRYVDDYMLRCDACDFDLCLYCASLPEKIWHRSDEHPLTLYYGRKASSENWCNICEEELDPSKWFFTCSDCGVTFHVQCVLGDFSRLIPECFFSVEKTTYKVVFNNHNTRPFCRHCHSRCMVPVILKVDDGEDNGYICSTSCFTSFSGLKLFTPRILNKE